MKSDNKLIKVLEEFLSLHEADEIFNMINNDDFTENDCIEKIQEFLPNKSNIEKIYIKLDSIDGTHISVISATKNKNVEAMEKIKIAFEEDMNCSVMEMSSFQVYEALDGKTAAIQIKYQSEDGSEPDQTTIFLTQTWIY